MSRCFFDVLRSRLLRLTFGGRLRPDDDMESARAKDILPCVLELRHAVMETQKLLEERDKKMKRIESSSKVRGLDNPKGCALALYLFDEEHKILSFVAERAKAKGCHILTYVFDGLYIVMDSEDDLKRSFKVIARECYDSTGIRLALKAADGSRLVTFKEISS